MSMQIPVDRVGIAFALAAGTTALLLNAPAVRADEAYLCGPDRIVYVAVADLERMKRTDPCIAAYYGMKVEEPAKPAANKPAAKAEAATPKAEKIVVPATKPAAAKPQAPAPLKAAPELKRLPEEAHVRRKPAASKLALAEMPVAAPGTDFRNVRVLNASSPDDAIFHHTK